MAECLVVIGALSTAIAEKLNSGNRSRSKSVLFCTVIAPEIKSTLKLLLWSPIKAYVTLPNIPIDRMKKIIKQNFGYYWFEIKSFFVYNKKRADKTMDFPLMNVFGLSAQSFIFEL